MTATTASVEAQMQTLMRGVEYGDAHTQSTMEAELRGRLAEGRPLRVYCGFDPTAIDLHLGHIVPMLKMRQFQQLGHEVTFVIGTMTGIIGDPTDKSATRQMMTLEQVNENAETWVSQALRVLDPEKTIFKRNASWLAPLSLADMVQVASNFTVSQFLEKESFRQRLEASKPIYIHEFIYAMLQAYDAYTLDTDVQIGGVDQLFNIMAGRQLQRAKEKRPLVAVTTPLLIGTDGHLKMSKSVGNYIGLDEEPAEKYGKVMSIPDSLITNYFNVLTEMPAEEIVELERAIGEPGFNPMETKKRLAREIIRLLDGVTAAEEAQSAFEQVFQRRGAPDQAIEVDWNALHFANEPSAPPAEVSLPHVIATAAGLSVAEARRLVSQGGVEVDGVKVSDAVVKLAPGSLIKAGRHRFVRIVGQG